MNELYKRKVQKTGIATYTISLPKAWVMRNSLSSGDIVTIYEDDDQTLKISIEEKSEKIKEMVIDIKEFNNEIEVIRKFIAHYINGISKIIIKSEKSISDQYLKKIVNQIKKVIGFEIIEESDKEIILQDFFTANYLSLNNAIKRQFNLSKLIIHECKKILNKEIKSLENVNVWEEEINRLYLLARRQINFALHNSLILKQLHITVKDCQNYLILIGAIEKLSDSFVDIANMIILLEDIPKKIITNLNGLHDKIIETYEIGFYSIFKKDFSLANEAISKCDEIKNLQIDSRKEKIKERSKINLYLILSKLETNTNFIEEIAEIGLDVN